MTDTLTAVTCEGTSLGQMPCFGSDCSCGSFSLETAQYSVTLMELFWPITTGPATARQATDIQQTRKLQEALNKVVW